MLDDIENRTLAPAYVPSLTWKHLVIVVISALLVVFTAIPLGIVLARPSTKFLSPVVTGIANVGQAAPVIGVIVLLAIWLGFGPPRRHLCALVLRLPAGACQRGSRTARR